MSEPVYTHAFHRSGSWGVKCGRLFVRYGYQTAQAACRAARRMNAREAAGMPVPASDYDAVRVRVDRLGRVVGKHKGAEGRGTGSAGPPPPLGREERSKQP